MKSVLSAIAKRIIQLKRTDLELRDELIENGQLGTGYHPDMEELHNRNARLLDIIIDQIAYPTIDKVGKKANQAAWLVIQHAIGQPQFMKKCVKLLEKAVLEDKANPQNLAYLTDRIAVFEGKLQLYGTQFDWDHEGELSPKAFDDLKKVNQRRLAIGLNKLEEQTIIIKMQAQNENQSPPADFEDRKREFEEWKRSVGWIK